MSAKPAHKPITSDEVCRKALLTLAAGIAEASSREFGVRVVKYLTEIADHPLLDSPTRDLLWEMISVVQPPEYTPRGMSRAFA